jgi:hypothetical protein
MARDKSDRYARSLSNRASNIVKIVDANVNGNKGKNVNFIKVMGMRN